MSFDGWMRGIWLVRPLLGCKDGWMLDIWDVGDDIQIFSDRSFSKRLIFSLFGISLPLYEKWHKKWNNF